MESKQQLGWSIQTNGRKNTITLAVFNGKLEDHDDIAAIATPAEVFKLGLKLMNVAHQMGVEITDGQR